MKEKSVNFMNKTYPVKDKIIGLNKGLKEVYNKVRLITSHPIDVLIIGETGVGKELIADLIHELSPRRNNNYIKLNCAAIPDTLLESELFGYAKGAFTGANVDKPGKIEIANEGTLFLDEISELKLDIQVKLLRVLQEREIERLGSNEIKKINFRLIAATNKDLEKCVSDKVFREDLFYRLNVFPIKIPPLRERMIDIEELFYFFIDKFSSMLSINKPEIESDLFKVLASYNWPGNTRELQNAVLRAIITSNKKGKIDKTEFDFISNKLHNDFLSFDNFIKDIKIQNNQFNNFFDNLRKILFYSDYFPKLKDLEILLISEAIKKSNGNQAEAAKLLGISPATMCRRLKN